VRAVRCLRKRITYPSRFYMLLPMLLEPRPKIDIPKGRAQRFWITVKVPDSAPPGVYRGELAVLAENAPGAKIPLILTVWPFRLEEPGDITWGLYGNGGWFASLGSPGEFERDLKEMREQGLNSVGLCGSDLPEAIEEEGAR